MRSVGFWISAVLAFALGTAVLGWWMVPVLGAVYGGLRPSARPALTAASAAMAAWALLLSLTATQGPVGRLAGVLAGALGMPGFALMAITLIFPALLAGPAAGSAGAVRDALDRRAAPTGQS